MSSRLRLVCLSLFLIGVFITVPYASVPRPPVVVDTTMSFVADTVTGEVIANLPVSRSLSNVLTLGPTVTFTVPDPNLPGDDRISGFDVYTDIQNSTAEFILRRDVLGSTGPPSKFFLCKELNDALQCKPLAVNGAARTAGGLDYAEFGNNDVNAILNIILKTPTGIASTGFIVNPVTEKLAGPRFPLFNAPESIFPEGCITSYGLSEDGVYSFQTPNFFDPGSQMWYPFVIFHQNGANGRPVNSNFKFSFPPGRAVVASGSISNRIEEDPKPVDRVFFTYNYYTNPGQPDSKKQVRVQSFNADTLVPMEKTFFYTPPVRTVFTTEELLGSVEIQKDGAFIAYSAYNASCNKNLAFVRMMNTETGAPFGPPRPVTKCTDNFQNPRNFRFTTGLRF